MERSTSGHLSVKRNQYRMLKGQETHITDAKTLVHEIKTMTVIFLWNKIRLHPPPTTTTTQYHISFGWYHEVINQIFDSTDERYTIRHLTGLVRSMIVQRTFCPLYIRYIFVLPVIHPLLLRQSTFVCYFSVTYALLMRFMRSLHLPRRPSSPPRRLSSPDEHRINIFLHFSVRLASVTFIGSYVTAP